MQSILPSTTLHFRFFDQTVRLSADADGYLAPFARLYSRFLLPAAVVLPLDTLDVTVYTTSNNPWGCPMLVVGGQRWPLADPLRRQGAILEYIFYVLMARVRSHILVHAAALTRHGRAVVLAGDAQHGKTTLMLALLRRGFGFLSDELAAFDRRTGTIAPFPRSLRVRPGSPARAGIDLGAEPVEMWLDKLILDVDRIRPGALAGPVPLGHLILLQNPADATTRKPPDAGLRLLVERADDTLLAALRQLDDVARVEAAPLDPYDAIHIYGGERNALLDRVLACCDAHGVLLLDVQKRVPSVPGFDAPARLEPVRPAEMVMELLRHFQGSHQSALLQEDHHGRAVGLFLELSQLVQDERCHRLYVGPLEQMVDLVATLADDRP